ncbi:CzcE family metal-binding protein [Denitromonas iodatirespirans]|mgnify:FL=1|jgi:hypothetical protein|uniref:CzcE family metal-binding protein n=1 Tax=Denitromonas iodatirespirans TaxID=2795389 RepID=A0A944DR27_DENI1|nr:CzcE family metal-binding protein [Denitromonas iodatirespirans]MBT0963034.1 CzcE family metal-binding protein [Denitromonas iodatirespirans]MCK9260138.1 CzcE family metal-binding protein [Azoarcus sp.]MCZ4307077.1 CzcE family metal-binding protein [Zoogloeaceae bacterium G21618-S1]PLX69071.1 MAG: hypothetical protein C0607_20605 [Azoarcus sp.]
MKTTLIKLSFIAAIGGVAATSAYAHPDYTEAGSHWLNHVSESNAQPSANQLAPFGYKAVAAPGREITLSGEAKYLNVNQLETVRITVDGKSLDWTFDTLGTRPFALSEVIPGAKGVTVYVSKNPDFAG